jgi:alkanesulfonate monooxygenase SsuD/methylene tetrahydromethanopterin reductase-like flavin-dependent oxidoreductase (luciferase family)
LAGELCDGFHVHPFHTPEYVEQVVKPAIAKGAGKEGRDTKNVTLATSVFVVTGETKKRSKTNARRCVLRPLFMPRHPPTAPS